MDRESGIRFSVVSTELGWLLVAGTSRGVCNVRFGADDRALEADLREEFPFADVHADPLGLAPWVEALLGYLEGRTRRLEVALDVRGSQFQRRVWDAIRAIPCGETRCYSELARGLGRPGAARAVAQACAANPVALAIPCHRVVRRDGEVGGYRYGTARKRALLDRESRAGSSVAAAAVACRRVPLEALDSSTSAPGG
jgi:AraC family transcriptional regulator of adaptative response/methylated-DNA-[protein]-cysteine methyltransferase